MDLCLQLEDLHLIPNCQYLQGQLEKAAKLSPIVRLYSCLSCEWTGKPEVVLRRPYQIQMKPAGRATGTHHVIMTTDHRWIGIRK